MTQTRTIRAMVAVDLVLVLTFVVMLVVYATSGPPGGGGARDAAVSTSPTASATSSAPRATAGPATFRLPSGNIACAMSEDDVTCTIASFTYAPPAVDGCTGTTGHVLVLDAGGVAFECETGPAPQAAGDDVPTLEYGSSSSSGDYTCTSGTDGVTCTNGEGVGFRLARASWTELP